MWKRCETFREFGIISQKFTHRKHSLWYTERGRGKEKTMTLQTSQPNRRIPALVISLCAVTALAAAFVFWLFRERPDVPGVFAAVLSLALFVFGCWRFVPAWLDFWFFEQPDPVNTESEPKHTLLLVALISLCVEVLLFFAAQLVQSIQTPGLDFLGRIELWRCLDSRHYLDIAREWYVFGEEYGRSVQLVFLPGYPIAVYPLYRLFNNDLFAGLLVSAAAFPAACCLLYRLLRLDLPHADALRATSFLWVLPGGFFFVAPMSESLFLLLCLAALYCMRKERFALAAIFGAYAAFTRSLGLTLIVPMTFEWARLLQSRSGRKRILSALPILAVPVGFLCYLWINYHVSGNAFQFLTFQKNHWGQELGWFFNTASYQTNLLLEAWTADRELFFGLWLPNLTAVFGALALFAATSKRLRPSYAAWFIAYFVIAIGTTWLLSAPRYLLAMPVIAMMLGLLTDRKWKYWLSLGVLVPTSALYLIAFVLRWQVW